MRLLRHLYDFPLTICHTPLRQGERRHPSKTLTPCRHMVSGSALAKRLPLERYYRDVCSAPMHSIGGYDVLEVIGKHAFGIPRDSAQR